MNQTTFTSFLSIGNLGSSMARQLTGSSTCRRMMSFRCRLSRDTLLPSGKGLGFGKLLKYLEIPWNTLKWTTSPLGHARRYSLRYSLRHRPWGSPLGIPNGQASSDLLLGLGPWQMLAVPSHGMMIQVVASSSSSQSELYFWWEISSWI